MFLYSFWLYLLSYHLEQRIVVAIAEIKGWKKINNIKYKIWGENYRVCVCNAKYKYTNVNKGYFHCLTNTVAREGKEEGKRTSSAIFKCVFVVVTILCYMICFRNIRLWKKNYFNYKARVWVREKSHNVFVDVEQDFHLF